MNLFYVGETVIYRFTVRQSSGAYYDPDTSLTITITDPDAVDVVDEASPTKDSTGHYHYDYSSSPTDAIGTYVVTITSVNSGRTTIRKDYFVLRE